MKDKNKLPREQQIRMENTLKELQALSKDEFIGRIKDGSILYDFASAPGAPISQLLDLILSQAGDEGAKLFEALCFANLRQEHHIHTQITLGHLIAENQNKESFTHFLDLACLHFPGKLTKLLMASRKGNGDHLSVLSLLAQRGQNSLILDCFERLNTHCPDDIGAVVTKKQSYMNYDYPVQGLQIFLLAFNMDATSLSKLFAIVAKSSPKKWASLLQHYEKDFPGQYLGHMLALKNNSIAFNQFLDLVVQYAPDVLPFLLQKRDTQYHTITYHAWNMGSSSSLIKLIEVVINHAPASLNYLLNVKNSFWNTTSLPSLLCQKHYSAMGKIIFKIIESSIPLDKEVWIKLRPHRIAVLDYMETLPPQERKEAISQCFKKDSPWRAYFDIQDHYVCSIFHRSNDVKHRLQAMQKAADLEIAEANTTAPAMLASA